MVGLSWSCSGTFELPLVAGEEEEEEHVRQNVDQRSTGGDGGRSCVVVVVVAPNVVHRMDIPRRRSHRSEPTVRFVVAPRLPFDGPRGAAVHRDGRVRVRAEIPAKPFACQPFAAARDVSVDCDFETDDEQRPAANAPVS